VLAAAPFLRELSQRRGAQRTLFAITCLIAGLCLAGCLYLVGDNGAREKAIDDYEIDTLAPLMAIGLSSALICALARPARGFAAFGGTLTVILLIVSFWVNPIMDDVRSGAGFVKKVEAAAAALSPGHELGFVAYKEQYLLYITRPIVNFGHARWREAEQEANDAAAWLAADPERMLLVEEPTRRRCFASAQSLAVDSANRIMWSLVSGSANPECARRGHIEEARTYMRGAGLRTAR
jgi:hypothetical protein